MLPSCGQKQQNKNHENKSKWPTSDSFYVYETIFKNMRRIVPTHEYDVLKQNVLTFAKGFYLSKFPDVYAAQCEKLIWRTLTQTHRHKPECC